MSYLLLLLGSSIIILVSLTLYFQIKKAFNCLSKFVDQQSHTDLEIMKAENEYIWREFLLDITE